VGIADEGWSVTTTDYFNKNPNAFTGGNHGYDNRLADMQVLFLEFSVHISQGYICCQWTCFSKRNTIGRFCQFGCLSLIVSRFRIGTSFQ
jgi:hypothetical protein